MALAEVRDRRLFSESSCTAPPPPSSSSLFAYAGVSEDRLEVLSRKCTKRSCVQPSTPSRRGLVDQAKRAGHDVVLLSGALEVVIRHLAEELGADHVIANRLELKGRVATGKILRPVVAGPTKARLLAEHARTHGHDLADCYAYSDSYSDVPMLSVVGHPAAVNPDKKLALLARGLFVAHDAALVLGRRAATLARRAPSIRATFVLIWSHFHGSPVRHHSRQRQRSPHRVLR